MKTVKMRLNKITLSNIRRFQSDVTIDVSDGATIILAPNGTGKTSIFEALELALTGKVKRLDFPPNHLIKESASEAYIKLDFTDSVFCEAKFRRGSAPVVSGEFNRIFGANEPENIPYLLRLTHILNQNNSEWLVQGTGENVGLHLNSLAIGKDATTIQKTVTSTKRALNKLLSELNADFELAEKKLSEWTEQLRKRAEVQSTMIDKLVDKDLIIAQLQNISASIKMKSRDLTNELPILNSFLSELQGFAVREQKTISAEIDKLNGAKSNVLEFLMSTQSIESLKNKLDALVRERDTTMRFITSREEKLNSLNVNLIDRKKLLFERDKQRSTIEEIEVNNSKQRILIDQIALLKVSISKSEKNLVQSKYDSAQIVEFYRKRDAIRKLASNIDLSRNKIDELKHFQIEWVDLTHEIQRQAAMLNEFADNLVHETRILEGLVSSSQANQQKLENSRSIYAGLSQNSDVIKEAIAVLASKVGHDDCDCPLCGANYIPPELYERIQASLKRIDGQLEAASRLLTVDEGVLNHSQSLVIESQTKIIKLKKDIDVIKLEIEQHENKLQFVRSHFLKATNQSECTKEIDELGDIITERAGELERLKVNLIPQFSEESYEEVAAKIGLINEQLAADIAVVNSLSLTLNQINTTNAFLAGTISDISDVTIIVQQINSTRDDINNLEKLISDEIMELDKLRSELSNKIKEIYEQRFLLDHDQSVLQKVQQIWSSLNLLGQPSDTTIELELIKKQAQKENIQIQLHSLINLQKELDRWNGYEEFSVIEKRLNELSGGVTNNNYEKNLQENYAKRSKTLNDGKLKVQTFNSFSENLKTESDSIHRRIEAINPVFTKLLSRIVVDSRFSSASVNHYDYYNKPHADFTVPFNDKTVAVSHVASEAQLTDVQLSFLLAMATRYQWSNWKALLLDDPTQHHDLVHAASVFDLFREYIAEKDFQIVMATHDAVQADFFKRKLENDGLPYNFYVLEADEHGVRATLQ